MSQRVEHVEPSASPKSAFDGMDSFHRWFIALWKYLGSAVELANRLAKTNEGEVEEFDELVDSFGGKIDVPIDGGLVVILHGYNTYMPGFRWKRDAIWKSILKGSGTTPKYACCLCPVMKFEHNGTMENVGKRAFDVLGEYSTLFPRAPILIVGISAGGRIATRLLKQMSHKPNPVHLVTIGAPLLGTSLLKVSYAWARHSCGSDFFKELVPNDAEQHIFEISWATELPRNQTVHHFYGRTDWVVFPPRRCVSPVGSLQGISACPHNLLHTHSDVLKYLEQYHPPAVPEQRVLYTDEESN